MTDKERKVRVPFQPLSFSSEHLAQENELIINYDTSNAYIRKGVENIKIPNSDNIQEIYKEKILELIGNTDFKSLEELENLLKPLVEWKEKMTTDDLDNMINTIKEILQKFEDIHENNESIIEMLLKKVDIEPGKGLSTNNFDTIYRDKLDGIEENANKYIHPKEKQCNYQEPVITVNGKKGDIKLTKMDIAGLETVDSNANNYKHPTIQQCSHKFPVTTVNTRDGVVSVSKNEIKLDIVKNYPIANAIESTNQSINNKYLIVKNTNSIIGDMIDNLVGRPEIIPKYILTINTTPSDATARVYYDGIWNIGKSHTLYDGKYNIEVLKSGYTTKNITTTISGANKTENVTLDAIKYTLTVNTTPSDATVKVYYNGKWNIGKSHSLPNGTYDIEVSKSGYVSKNITTIISGTNKTETVSLSLEAPKTYTLTINTTPSDADVKVYYNGKWNVGKSHSLPNSTYDIEVSKSGYITKSIKTIIEGSNKVENVLLETVLRTITINSNTDLIPGEYRVDPYGTGKSSVCIELIGKTLYNEYFLLLNRNGTNLTDSASVKADIYDVIVDTIGHRQKYFTIDVTNHDVTKTIDEPFIKEDNEYILNINQSNISVPFDRITIIYKKRIDGSRSLSDHSSFIYGIPSLNKLLPSGIYDITLFYKGEHAAIIWDLPLNKNITLTDSHITKYK